jgi:hypothetical protein
MVQLGTSGSIAYNGQGLLHVAVFENMMLGTKVKLKNKS